jgi:hypothetical protein
MKILQVLYLSVAFEDTVEDFQVSRHILQCFYIQDECIFVVTLDQAESGHRYMKGVSGEHRRRLLVIREQARVWEEVVMGKGIRDQVVRRRGGEVSLVIRSLGKEVLIIMLAAGRLGRG